MKKRCPNEETLADYMEGRLSSEDSTRIEAHLSDCDMCLEHFVVGASLNSEPALENEPAPAHVIQSALRLVRELNVGPYETLRKKAGGFAKGVWSKISDYLDPVFREDDLVLVRGEESAFQDAVRVKKRFGGLDADIEIEKKETDRADIRVGLGDKAQGRGIRVTLEKADREIASFLFEEYELLFEDVPFGHYHLVLSEQGRELGTYAFELK